jgi:4-amino-4-deoxy-L-arabinose transferase-like glycosyltransferase
MLLAYFAALIPALVLAITQPVWSLVDEAQHFDFIVQLSHGVYPAADMTLIDPQTVRVSEQTGVFRAFYPAGTYPVPDLTDVGVPPPGMGDRVNAAWMLRHMWQLSHESVQTPVYYVAMVPVWLIANGLGGPFAAIYALRLINALVVATLAPMAVAIGRLLVPARPEIAVLAAVFAILLPGLDLNGTRISNDAFAAAIGGLVVLLAVRWAGSGWSWRRALLAGVVMGAALMIKITLAGLFPALALSAFWPAPGTTWQGRLAKVLVSGAIAIACLAPWFLVNIDNYGALTPGALASRVSDALPGPLTASFVVLDLAVFELTFWTGEPWGVLPLAAPLAVLGGLLALMAPVGIAKLLRVRVMAAMRGPLAVATVAVLGMIAVSLLLPVTAHYEFVGPGRYVYPALPAVAALCAIGIHTVLRSAFAQRAAVGAYSALAVIVLGAGALGLPAPPQPGTGTPPPGARVVSVAASGDLQGMSIRVDRVAFDTSAGATWLEVTVSNSGPDEAEWTVPPVVSCCGVFAKGNFLRSTHLPGDIDAGQTVTGWLFVPLDPAGLRANQSLHVGFPDVSADGYRNLGEIDLEIPLSGLTA